MTKQTLIIHIVVILVGAILLPIGVNYMLNCSIGANVTGESKDWLSFFGSYIGGVFTAYISYFILLNTIEQNKKMRASEIQREEFKSLKNMLSEQVSMLDFSRVGTIALVINNKTEYKNEIHKLDIFQQNLTQKFNSYSLFYFGTTDKYAANYWEAYNACILQLFNDITSMTKMITELEGDNSVEGFYEIKNRINELIQQLGKRKENYTDLVFTQAQLWIQSGSEKLKSN